MTFEAFMTEIASSQDIYNPIMYFEAHFAASRSKMNLIFFMSNGFFPLLFQSNFETMFREYELNATFHYLRSFRRVRVDFEAHFAASSAKLSLNGTPLGDNVIQCYFLQVSPIKVSLYFLSLKAPNRLFLFFPPNETKIE